MLTGHRHKIVKTLTVLRKERKRKVSKYSLLREKVFKLPYVSGLLPLHQWIKSKSCILGQVKKNTFLVPAHFIF